MRPEGWVEQIKSDAKKELLEGLRKDGWKLTGDTVIPARGEYPEIHVPSGMKGHLVFIPEEEE